MPARPSQLIEGLAGISRLGGFDLNRVHAATETVSSTVRAASNVRCTVNRMSLMRSRWAAIGAAVAVTLGAGGLISVNAANDTSSLVPITPARILDTRSGDRVGSLDTAGASDPYRLKVVGTDGIPTSGVTGVSLNVTAVDTRTNDYGGFVSVYPCAAVSSAKPDVSNINFGSGQTIANAVTVPVSADGYICLYVYGTAHLLVDANGYYTQTSSGTVDAYTKSEIDTKLNTLEGAIDAKAGQESLRMLALRMQSPITLDASSSTAGKNPTVVIGATGNPVIAYSSDDNLKVAACASVTCEGIPIITYIDNGPIRPESISLAVGEDGKPIISYSLSASGELKTAYCTQIDCSGSHGITTHNTGDSVLETAIAIGGNGLPVIAYYDLREQDLKVIACSTSDCSAAGTPNTIDPFGIAGIDVSIAIGSNGFPFLAYFDDFELAVAACSNADCSAAPTITTIDDSGATGYYSSIAIRDNGHPVISYYHLDARELRAAACANPSCTGTPTITTVDTDEPVAGTESSIALNEFGFPVISYEAFDGTVGKLKVAECSSVDCTGTATISTLDESGDIDHGTSIAIAENGVPLVVYHEEVNDELRTVALWSSLFPDDSDQL